MIKVWSSMMINITNQIMILIENHLKVLMTWFMGFENCYFLPQHGVEVSETFETRFNVEKQ